MGHVTEHMHRLWLPLVCLAVPLFGDVRVTYLANEGILLTDGNTKVLVDALFRDSLDDYARHEAETQERLESGKPPFDGVTLALATHYHLDHWDAGAISRFLRLNPGAMFASTPQATGMIPRSLQRRTRVLWPGDAPLHIEAAGVRVEAFPLEHGQTQNMAYAISMGGRTLIHVGDAEPTKVNFDRLLTKQRPHVAFVPFWWLLDQESRAFVTERWKPQQVAAFHFGATDAREAAERVRRAVQGVWLCVRPGESRSY